MTEKAQWQNDIKKSDKKPYRFFYVLELTKLLI